MESYYVKLDRAVYPKEALLKAAYFFVKDYYIHLDQDEKYYNILISAKGVGELSANIASEFENELLTQTVRYQVYCQTHVVREILLARAMASSMVMDEDPIDAIAEESEFCSCEELDTILKDWFEHEE